MSIFNSKKELYQKVLNTKNIFDEISKISILKTQEEKDKFKELNKKLSDWVDRLKDERFKIALIGTTSSGKSTFANALLQNDLLPEDDKTTTYTSASIESSDKDEVVIEFYRESEFKDKFQELLRFLKIENENFDTINDYKIFELLKEEWQKSSSYSSEIKEILKDKEEIRKHLDKDTIYLKIVSKDEIKDYITKPAIARAVKKITIYSSKFQGMRDLIIFDVPGFDSPTRLHKEQAERFMKDSEIVVLVHGYGTNSDLNESQVNMLTSTKDEFGNLLSNKMIVVGNKIDKEISNNQEEAKEKIRKLSKDLIDSLKKYNVYKEKNFIPVSAKGFLEEKGIIQGNEITTKLKNLNISNGFEEFHKRLKEVLSDDALEVLNRVVEKVLSESRDFLTGFAKDYNPKFDEKKKQIDFSKLVDEEWERVKLNLKRKLNDKKLEIGNKSYNINNDITEQVSQKWILKITEKVKDYIKEQKIATTSGKDSITSPTTINDGVRAAIYKESLEYIIQLSTDVIDKDTQNEVESIFDLLKESIFKEINIPQNTLDELRIKFDSITTPYQYQRNSYRPLINRFLDSIFEVIVLARVGSKARKEKFKKYEDSILGLLHITRKYDDSKDNNFEQDIIQNILIQKENVKLEGIAFDNLLSKLKEADSDKEVEEEIIYDLKKLEEIFNDIIIVAAQVETPFKHSLQDQIQAIITQLEKNSINESKLKEFINENIGEIAKESYRRLETDEELKRKIMIIIKKIDEKS